MSSPGAVNAAHILDLLFFQPLLLHGDVLLLSLSLIHILFGVFGCGSFVLGAALCYLAILYTRGEDLLPHIAKLVPVSYTHLEENENEQGNFSS